MANKYDIRTFKKRTLKFDEILYSKVYTATCTHATSSVVSKRVAPFDGNLEEYKLTTKNTYHFLLMNKFTGNVSYFNGTTRTLVKFLREADLHHFYSNDKNVNYAE